jgi:hypothetical protein
MEDFCLIGTLFNGPLTFIAFSLLGKTPSEKLGASFIDTSVARDRCYDFLNIFAEKFGEKMAFLTQNKAKLCKNMIITLVFEKNANFFAENCRKSLKIVIITSTPGGAAARPKSQFG